MATHEPANIYVCNLMGDMLYPLDEIDKSSVSLTEKLNGQWELGFTYTKSKDEHSPAYEALEEGMYLYLEDKAHFKMRQPSIRIDAATESKEIHAFSCEVELEDKNITFSVNMGEETSLEYLLNDGEDELPYTWTPIGGTATEEVELLKDPYTTIPYDWIVLYNTYPQQLREFITWYDQQTPDGEGKVTVERGESEEPDADFAYCEALTAQIKRLCSKAENVGDIYKDASTVHEVDPNQPAVSYTYTQYVTFTKNEDSTETLAITFEPTVRDRALHLICFYETYRKSLSLLDILCDQTNGMWEPGDIYGLDQSPADYTVANMRYQFDIDESIYSFLTSTYAQRTRCLVTFDRLLRRINVTPVEQIGNDTGIALAYDQLLNTLNITTNEDTLATRITVHGADNLSIEQVNFGEDQLVDIDYKMNAKDSDGKRIYVSDALAEKYADYLQYREDERQAYIVKTRERNGLNQQIHELKERVPASIMSNAQWDTYTDDELRGSLAEYSNKLYALQQLYATDYGRETNSAAEAAPWVDLRAEINYQVPDWRLLGDDETVIPRTEFIIQTMYWWDYVAYCQTITQINIAMQARHIQDVSFKFSNISPDSKNEDVRKMYDCITAWETEWSLYGTIELANKISAYDNELQAMIDGDAVDVKHCAWSDLATKPYETVTPVAGSNPHADGLLESIGDEYVITGDTLPQAGKTYYSSLQTCFVQQQGMTADAMYNAACEILEKKEWGELSNDDKTYFVNDQAAYNALKAANIISKEPIPWNQLTQEQQSNRGNMEANYFYNEYKEVYDKRQDAQEYLDRLNEELGQLESELETVQTERNTIADNARLATYQDPETGASFSDYELKVINLLLRDSDYTNDYILTTSLNDTVTSLDEMEKLYQDAVDKIRLFSRPQLIFSADMDNLLSLPEFAAWHADFDVGNFIYVEYRDGMSVRVRMIGRTYNPCIVGGNLTVDFSNVTYTKTEVSDVENVLGLATTTTSSGGGGSSGGSGGGSFEELLAKISNSMLERLLSPEAFIKEVSDVVANKVVKNKLTSREQVYQSLARGLANVDGTCLKGSLIESEQTVTHQDEHGNMQVMPMSWLNLDDGTFNFGDGALMFHFGDDGTGQPSHDDEGNPVGWLVVKGQIEADSGKIAGVQIGWPYSQQATFDPRLSMELTSNKMCIGNNGIFLDAMIDDPNSAADKLGCGFSRFQTELGSDGIPYAYFVLHRIEYYNTAVNPTPGQWSIDASHVKQSCSSNFYPDRIHMSGNKFYDGQTQPYQSGDIAIDAYTGNITASGKISGGSVSASGNISTTNGSVSGASVSATGQISGGSVSATGSVSGASVSATGAVSGNTVSATDTVSGKSLSASNGVKGNYANFGNYSNTSPGRVTCKEMYYGSSHVKSADYAELFEWVDGNAADEDRRGRFVTMEGDKIRLASLADKYLLGIISGSPSIVGNAAWDNWHDKYLLDEFGAILTHPVEYQAVLDDDGNILEEAHVEYEPVLNPDYDPTREYIPREERPEWAPVGMVGQIIMLDDGTCEVNGFATSADEGIATKADGITNYRVIKRIDSNHIMVAAK